jgi:myo-inositol 2-dehydrogenase/D-chiro-inositol 1-dehydrogenase
VRIDPAIGAAGDVDTALIVLTFVNGIIATIDNSREAVYGYDQRVEVLGSAGSISVENNYPNTATVSTAESVRRDLPLNFFMDRYTESFLSEMTQFVACVRDSATIPVTGQDARAAYLIAQAAGESHRTGKHVTMN